jgi:hypothetical protein
LWTTNFRAKKIKPLVTTTSIVSLYYDDPHLKLQHKKKKKTHQHGQERLEVLHQNAHKGLDLAHKGLEVGAKDGKLVNVGRQGV